MNNHRALFLDFDGTLADSIPNMQNAFYEFLEIYNLSPKIELFLKINGPPLIEIVEIIKKQFQIKISSEEMHQTYQNIIASKYNEIAPTNGSIPLLKKAKHSNMSVFIVTSNQKLLVSEWLAKWNLEHFIDEIIACEDVKFGKPHPNPYLIAKKKSKCKKTNLLAVEDSLSGALSALRAQLKIYCLLNEFTQHARFHPDFKSIHWIDSLFSLVKII